MKKISIFIVALFTCIPNVAFAFNDFSIRCKKFKEFSPYDSDYIVSFITMNKEIIMTIMVSERGKKFVIPFSKSDENFHYFKDAGSSIVIDRTSLEVTLNTENPPPLYLFCHQTDYAKSLADLEYWWKSWERMNPKKL